MSNAAKNFWHFNVITILSILHNYFDSPTKLCSDLAKFLNTSAKLFFTTGN